MSVTITVKDAVKKYGDVTVLKNLSVTVREGEFFTLLGPSGCGKTTLLRMIAGFNSIEGGEFYFNETLINEMAPAKRNIGMVFQNYAIFPHLSVESNVAFGLKNRKVLKTEISRRVDEILKTMQIEQYRSRQPEKLSGGQQQRVALARAIVIEPDVLLMDEPLSNLDAKLRVEMRTAIKQIQQKVNITTIYVTHDQEEAMSVSDRIAVMKDGIIQHIGTPQNIYQRPSNLFVATFIGRSNILDGTLSPTSKGTGLSILGSLGLVLDQGVFSEAIKDQPVKISIRPEEFIIRTDEYQESLKGTIKLSTFLGLNTHYIITLENGMDVDVVEESAINHLYQIGETVYLSIKQDKINVFTYDGEKSLMSGVVNDNAANQT